MAKEKTHGDGKPIDAGKANAQIEQMFKKMLSMETDMVAMSDRIMRFEEKIQCLQNQLEESERVKNEIIGGLALSSKDFIEIFNINEATLGRWRNREPPFNLPAFKRGRMYFYHYEVVLSYLTKGFLVHKKEKIDVITVKLQRYKENVLSAMGIGAVKKDETKGHKKDHKKGDKKAEEKR